MDQEAQTEKKPVMYGKSKPKQNLPPQTAIGEELPQKKNPVLRVILKILAVLAIAVILVLAYLFLLMGEPEEEQKNTIPVTEAAVQGPMTPIEGVGEGSLATLPSVFEDEVLYLTQGATLERSRISDTASGGKFARVVSIQYLLPDGTSFEVRSLRPTSAAALLKQDGGFTLDGSKLYSLAGMNAARMSNGKQSVIFAQSDTAVYAVIFPEASASEVIALLRTTALLSP